MRYAVAIVAVLMLVWAGTSLGQGGGEAGEEIANPQVRDLLSAKQQMERWQALRELGGTYRATRQELAAVLAEAAGEHREDGTFMSPLDATISAVAAWRVYEAEDTLLSIVDYQLDGFPPGMSVGASAFYPAASALVSLRVDPEKVIRAMVVQAEGDRQIQLLTWVLAQRAGSADEAKAILEATGRNEKIHRAIAILDGVERVSDLLPPPRR